KFLIDTLFKKKPASLDTGLLLLSIIALTIALIACQPRQNQKSSKHYPFWFESAQDKDFLYYLRGYDLRYKKEKNYRFLYRVLLFCKHPEREPLLKPVG